MRWLSTGFLWSQWLVQDLANIYAYIGHTISPMRALHAYTFCIYGGGIQKIVTSKTNTRDIRSASLIDLQFGIVLLLFKEWSALPMSTTWVFLGVLAGREIELASKLRLRPRSETSSMLGGDLAKAGAGLVVSVVLALGFPLLSPSRHAASNARQETTVQRASATTPR